MTKDRFWGSVHLSLWALLILAGIVAKRSFGHPDWMVFFHLPAAVFLVLGFYRLSAPFRLEREREIRRLAQESAKSENLPPKHDGRHTPAAVTGR